MRSSKGQLGTLSTREYEVASLVAAGKSNREIADALCLSERTVEHHVTAAFNKLNVRTRVELAATILLRSSTPPQNEAPRQNAQTSTYVFVSYARADDLQEIPEVGKGFVTTLWQHLELRFRLKGPPAPALFCDTREVRASDDAEPTPFEGMKRAQTLLVVLSNNWLHRAWCTRELEWFEKLWRPQEGDAFRSRIVVVAPRPMQQVPPASLRHCQTYQFFRVDEELGKPAIEYDFFKGGEPRMEFHDVIERLRDDLYSRRAGRSAEMQSPSAAPVLTPASPVGVEPAPIYLAKPSGDMERPYRQLGDALIARGHRIVPELNAEIPIRGAREFISARIQAARYSFHLLGTGRGFTPEDGIPIVQLQLEIARGRSEHALAAALHEQAGGGAAAAFRRIVWSPRILGTDGASPVQRDVEAVLCGFDYRVEGDKLDDGDVTRFIEFALQHLERQVSGDAGESTALRDGASVYVYHRADDREYGRRVARALRELKLRPIIPASEGSLARQIHESTLRDCDAVVLGWVNADDSWVRATARQWRDWRILGRERAFLFRGLVIGPPKREAMEDLIEFPPPEVDIVLDLTAHPDVQPQELAELVARIYIEKPS